MIKRGYIAFITLIIITSISLGVIYYYYEKPNSFKDYGYSNISIGAFYDKKHIEIGYKIFSDGILIKEGKTLDRGYILEKVPINKSLKISTYNLDNQYFYTTTKIFTVNTTDAYRLNLNLVSPGDINIKQRFDNASIFLDIEIDGEYRHPIYCLEWSDDILYLDSTDRQIERFENYSRYDKCYIIDQDFINQNYTINISYVKWNRLKDSNFVNVLFLDSEYEVPINKKKEINFSINNI